MRAPTRPSAFEQLLADTRHSRTTRPKFIELPRKPWKTLRSIRCGGYPTTPPTGPSSSLTRLESGRVAPSLNGPGFSLIVDQNQPAVVLTNSGPQLFRFLISDDRR